MKYPNFTVDKCTCINIDTSSLPNVSQQEESGFILTPGGPVSPENSRPIKVYQGGNYP